MYLLYNNVYCKLIRLHMEIFLQGVNPLLQTKRGKVQQRRCALNEQISKQIRLRNGAENLLRYVVNTV